MTIQEFDKFIEKARNKFLAKQQEESLKTIEDWPQWKKDWVENHFKQSEPKS